MKRSAGFGYGGKFDFTKTALKTPAPDTYNIQSIFTNTGGKVKGSSIGVGREVRISFPLTKISRVHYKNKVFFFFFILEHENSRNLL